MVDPAVMIYIIVMYQSSVFMVDPAVMIYIILMYQSQQAAITTPCIHG